MAPRGEEGLDEPIPVRVYEEKLLSNWPVGPIFLTIKGIGGTASSHEEGGN